jgi:hypothetical protein
VAVLAVCAVLVRRNLCCHVVDGDIDVTDVKVDGGDEVDAGNLGDSLEDLGAVPRVEDERRQSDIPRRLVSRYFFSGSVRSKSLARLT